MAITEVAPGIMKIDVSLPESPLRSTNAYFLPGPDRNLLIDTGFNHEISQTALTEALRELSVDMARTDIFVTHLHSDHGGLAASLARPGTRIFMSGADGRVVAAGRESDFWQSFFAFFRSTGLLAGGYVTSLSAHSGYKFAPPACDGIIFVPDGHEFRVGGRTLRCLLTQGHTRGHMCLYDAAAKILFCGDHVLASITPNITQISFDHDALAEFLASLTAIQTLDVRLALPGHRRVIENFAERIDDLRRHHAARLEEAMTIVRGRDGASSVDVAKAMRWSLTIENWLDFQPAQKLFSAGEALAHLYHLTRRGSLTMAEDGEGVVRFSAKEQ